METSIKWVLIVGLIVASAACSGGSDSPDQADGAVAADAVPDASSPPPTRIYATIVSHNDDWPANGPCNAMATGGRYAANRDAALAFAEMVIERDAAYDLQTALDYLELVEAEGDDLFRQLAERSPEHVVVDAHAHQGLTDPYNTADVASRLEGLGVPTTGIVGGFVVCPSTMENWTDYWELPVTGRRYPGYEWSPIAMWGGGSPGHSCDPELSGMWRPLGPDELTVDDPSRELIAIGNGIPVEQMLALLSAGALEEHRMYTATLMVSQCNFDLPGDPSSPAAVAAAIDALAPEVEAGHLVWATLPELVEIWRDDYGMAPSIYVAD